MKRVAYFCMEYGLHEEFPIYAGGLGILAGDYLKAAAENDFPIVGIGILWHQGYTKQLINEHGQPYDVFPNYEYDFLKDTGVKVPVHVRGKHVMCKVWKVDKYQNAPLYLLDTDLPENDDKWISNQLYGGYSEDRVAQEIVLGVGGVRALRALGIPIDVYHFNEGHAVFAGLELIREKMRDGVSFHQACHAVREQIVFTTHTPVKEGNESHDHGLLSYMGASDGFSFEQMVEIGGNPFNMTVAGLRLSRIANGVSSLHCDTARKMWRHVDNSAPIIGITNGIHAGTWRDERVWHAFENSGDIWEAHMAAKRELIEEIYARTGVRLDADSLLIGFARRAAPYKRSDLIFSRLEVIEPHLRSGRIQLVFSGKAHPLDHTGKSIVSRLVEMSKRYPESVVFLQDYDMKIGRLLTRGTDVWLNNPRRPQEASGTSGMKAAMNGVLNVSILDGWWPEGCRHGVNGWQIGKPEDSDDQQDAEALYQVLFNEVIPTYYENRPRWVEMMKSSINMAYPRFSAKRMLEEYYQLMYEPAVVSEEGYSQVASSQE